MKTLCIAAIVLIGLLLMLLLTRPSLSGQKEQDFTIALKVGTPTVHLHDPIWATVHITNASGVPQQAWFGPRFVYQFRIVKNETESVVANNPESQFGYDQYIGHEYTVVPGDSMFGRFRLDLMYQFKTPGVYSIKVTKAGAVGKAMRVLVLDLDVPSNTATITVLP
jgi:hypothetical protein